MESNFTLLGVVRAAEKPPRLSISIVKTSTVNKLTVWAGNMVSIDVKQS
jgi:hypothetical protein